MSRFDRYLLAQLTVLFGFFSLVLVSVYWINRAVILFDQLIADGQSASVFFEFTALSLPNVIRLVLPMAAFIAAVYMTNRLSSESELVVARATGVSAFRMARPVAVFGIMASLMMAVLVNLLVPISRTQLAEREVEIQTNITARMLTEGQFLHPANGITFYLREITPQGELLDVFLSDDRAEESRTTYLARKAYLIREEDGPKLVMFDGTAQTFNYADQRLFTTNFDDFSYDIGRLIVGGDRDKRDVREYLTPALFFPTPEALAATRKDRAVFLYEGHLRLAQPLSPLVAALIGFAALMVGGFSRFGVWKQIILAIFLLIGVQVLENMAANAARKDAELWYLVYVPPAVGLMMAGVLLVLAERPNLFRRRPRLPEAQA
ncbi:LPS export ABC transporter permease LptF [Actibacterium sp. 188UL27-1]|uniref:LPS export ABC transporter permease LptF n=1 Tax=Actibacterium sp. 188UL27-1 TaxID=2786961 RepID=UPI00195ADC6E|nr:LPS export ABC transporter permease LptF [Actibacterium sp. 188UL27-1]